MEGAQLSGGRGLQGAALKPRLEGGPEINAFRAILGKVREGTLPFGGGLYLLGNGRRQNSTPRSVGCSFFLFLSNFIIYCTRPTPPPPSIPNQAQQLEAERKKLETDDDDQAAASCGFVLGSVLTSRSSTFCSLLPNSVARFPPDLQRRLPGKKTDLPIPPNPPFPLYFFPSPTPHSPQQTQCDATSTLVRFSSSSLFICASACSLTST